MIKAATGLCVFVLLSGVGAANAAVSQVADETMNGDRTAVRTLIGQNANVNTPQVDGTTALHWAVQANDLETADLLIRAGAKVEAANHEGATPLLLATINGNAPMIEALIKAGANPNAALTRSDDTALMMASRTGKLDAVKVLLERGADVNAKSKFVPSASGRGFEGTTPVAAKPGQPAANVDPRTATPAEIAKIRKIQIGYQVDGLTGGLGQK